VSLETLRESRALGPFLRLADSMKSRDYAGLISDLKLLVTLYIAIVYIA
jgi:hypothetical protein